MVICTICIGDEHHGKALKRFLDIERVAFCSI